MTTPHRLRRRELERQLADVPTPPPPAGLLDRIRQEIPADLDSGRSTDGAGVPTTPWHRRPLLRLVAGLAIAAAGLSISLQVVRSRDQEISLHDGTGFDLRTAPGASGSAAQGSPSSKDVEAPSKRVVISSGQGRDERLPMKEAEKAGPSAAPGASGAAPGNTRRSVEASASPKRLVVEFDQRTAPPALIQGPDSTSDAATRPNEAEIRARAEGIRRQLRRLQDAQAAGASGPEPTPTLVERDKTSAQPAGISEELRALGEPTVHDRVVSSESPPLEEMPTARDPYRVLPASPGAQADRISVAPPSTGGTAEPNEAAFGDMFFRGTGTNPFVDTAEDYLSTFALDVDTGSWTLARAYLDRGVLPPAEAIRVEEFVNAQRYRDPAPRRGDFMLVAEGAPSPFAPPGDYRLLRFAVKGREIDLRDRRPAHLTFVVDVSGSMGRENRLGLVKRALHLLITELGRDDRVALVVYGSRGRVVLRPTRDLHALREAIDSLHPEGSTNAEEGLRLGYELAGEMYRSGAVNRVVLCSDGVANVGATGPESVLERIGSEARRGIELTTVGFGMGNYNDALMEQLADRGDGRYHYVDTLEEARRLFVEGLTGTLETIARDAKVQVEFDPAAVERWRLLGYENRDVADRDFRNDAVDAGELGAGHAAVALYEVRLSPRARGRDRLATLRLRWQSAATGRVEEASLDLRARDLESSFHHASPDLRRAALAAELAEMLKGSFYAREASWRTLVDEAYRLERDQADPRALRRLSELTERIERAARLAAEDRPPAAFED